MKFVTDIYGPQKCNPNDFGLNFSFGAIVRLTFVILSEMCQ